MIDIPRIQSRYTSRCRCGCNKIIRRGDVIGHVGNAWVRISCAKELMTISMCPDPYIKHRMMNARRGVEPDILHPAVTEDEPFVSEWLDEDLLCEDVVCPGLG